MRRLGANLAATPPGLLADLADANDTAYRALSGVQNVRGMIHNRDPKLDQASTDAAEAVSKYATLAQLAADYEAALQASLADRQALHAKDVDLDQRLTTQEQRAMTAGPPGEPGKSAYQLARDAGYGGTQTQWLAGLRGEPGAPGVSPSLSLGAVNTLSSTAQATASITGSQAAPVLNLGIPAGPQGAPGTPADMSRITALETRMSAAEAQATALSGAITALTTRVSALEAKTITVANGAASLPASLLAGASASVAVTLTRPMGSTSFSVGYALEGGQSLLGNVSITGFVITSQSVVTLTVRNNGLTGLLNLSTATAHVVAVRNA